VYKFITFLIGHVKEVCVGATLGHLQPLSETFSGWSLRVDDIYFFLLNVRVCLNEIDINTNKQTNTITNMFLIAVFSTSMFAVAP